MFTKKLQAVFMLKLYVIQATGTFLTFPIKMNKHAKKTRLMYYCNINNYSGNVPL